MLQRNTAHGQPGSKRPSGVYWDRGTPSCFSQQLTVAYSLTHCQLTAAHCSIPCERAHSCEPLRGGILVTLTRYYAQTGPGLGVASEGDPYAALGSKGRQTSESLAKSIARANCTVILAFSV